MVKQTRVKQGLLVLVLLGALLLFGFTLVFLIQEIADFTGRATTSAVTVSVTVLLSNASLGNVTNATTGTGVGSFRAGDLTFMVIPDMFSLENEEGEDLYRALRIINTGDLTRDFIISTNTNFVMFDKKEFTLRPGEETTLMVTFTGMKVGINTGVIIVSTDFASKQVPVIINTHSADTLFTIKFIVPPAFRITRAGGDIFSTLKIEKLEGGFVDVKYVLINAHNSIIYEEKEILRVTDTITIDKTMKIPSYIKQGSYAFGVIVNYRGKTRTASELITVREPGKVPEPTLEKPSPPQPYAGYIAIVLLLLVTVHYILSKRFKKKTTPLS